LAVGGLVPDELVEVSMVSHLAQARQRAQPVQALSDLAERGGSREGEGLLGQASPCGLVDGEARDSSSNLLQ
jgi:hypothetical protein